MSRLDDLIKEKCPNGVNFPQVGDICEVLTGGEAPVESIKAKNPDGEYIYPVYSNGVGDNAIWGYAKTYRVNRRAVTFSSIGTIGCPTLRESNFTPIIRLKVLYPNDKNLVTVEYIKYALETIEFESQKSSVPNINADMIKRIRIPVPPLEVQNEIVQILDNFAELTAELTAELSNRKKQYEYYRDLLLNFDENEQREVRWLRLGDIATILRGGSLQKKDFVESGVPCIHYGQIYTRYGMKANKTLTFINKETALKQRFAETNDIVMAVTSENLEDVCKCVVWLGSEKAAVSGHTAIIKHEQDARYLAYYFGTSMFFAQKRKYAHGTKVIEVSPAKLADIVIPIPPIEVQREIADKLDRFSDLSSDISEGLPAEIEARQKQYAYYRDKLLTFEESK